MNRTRLRKRFLKSRPIVYRLLYRQSRKFCFSLIKKAKAGFYSYFNHKKFTDNKYFWKFVKPHFSDKSSAFSKITLVENDLILGEGEDTVFVMNGSFSNVASS